MRTGRRLCLLLTCALLGWTVVRVLWFGVDILTTPAEVVFPEAVTVHNIARVSAGQPLYIDYRHAPFLFTQYTPAYYLLCGALGWLFGVDAMHLAPVARVVSFASFVLIGLLIGATTYRWGRDPIAALFSVLLFAYLTIAVCRHIVLGAHPHLLATLFSLIGFVVFVGRDRTTGSSYSVIPLVLAIYTKQSAVAAPAAIMVALIIGRPLSRFPLGPDGVPSPSPDRGSLATKECQR